MIRHYDGTNAEQIVMQSKRGAIWVLVWGHMNLGYQPKGHRVCITLKEAEQARQGWARWQERQGLHPTGHYLMRGMFAYPPGERARYCQIHQGDPTTRRVLDVR